MQRLTIGTRGSVLALWQADWVAAALRRRYADLEVAIERIVALADADPERPIAAFGTKGLFTQTIEDALRDGRIDLAVHSLKDLASASPPGLALAAIPTRADPRDVLVSPLASSLDALPSGAVVGTSAPRRRAQLRRLRPDLRLEEVRGNVDTRLRKLAEGRYDALILAAAGLIRLGRQDAITAYIDPAIMVPSGGQGALGIQTRADDARVIALVAPLADREAMLCCTAERRLQELLDAGCRVPIGAYAHLDGLTLTLDAIVAAEDGSVVVRDTVSGPSAGHLALAERLAASLLQRGAAEILAASP